MQSNRNLADVSQSSTTEQNRRAIFRLDQMHEMWTTAINDPKYKYKV